MFHKQHGLCLRGHSTDRKQCLHTHTVYSTNRGHSNQICLEGHRCLESVMHLSHANETGTWGGCLTWERGEKPFACKGCLRLQLHFNAVLSLFTRGHQRSGFSLSSCWLICAVYTQEPLNSLKLCISKYGLLFLFPTTPGLPLLLLIELLTLRELYQHFAAWKLVICRAKRPFLTKPTY